MTRRVALYARVSTDQNQTVENQLRELHASAARLGGVMVAMFDDGGISEAKAQEQPLAYDALLKGTARGKFGLVAAWSVCRLRRLLQDLVAFLGEVQNRQIGVYLHLQGLDSTTPGGRGMFGMLSVFSDFKAAMIRDRIVAGLNRTKSKGTRLGRPTPTKRVKSIRAMLESGKSIREVARATGAGTASVQRVKATMMPEAEQIASAA